MLNPKILLSSLAEKLRLIPELSGIPVYTYDEQFPIQHDLYLAIWKLQAPSLLVVWRGTSPASKTGMEAWRHSYSIIMRSSSDQSVLALPVDYFYLWTTIMNGVPADGQNCDLRHNHIHEAVYQMQPPSILRQTVFVTPESRLDYHEIFLAYDEKGDF